MQNTTTTSNEKDGQIYVLAAAINTYQSEDVSNLQGCVKDIDDLYEVLKAQYDIPEENYLILKNEEVSRANLIQSFRSHFSKLKDGDTAVFHYSGHGSWEDGSPEFVEAGLETAGNRNELIVVQNYGEEGVFNIADKELRWMISELQFPKDQAPRNIQFIGLMDCCFSGSLFRDTEKRSRITLPQTEQKRRLADYLEGQYQEMYDAEGKVAFPDANFILFTACSPRESALEGRNGGLFTQALTKALEDAKTNPPAYADLHTKIKHIIEVQSGQGQHPFLEYEGKVNPFQSFLSQEVKAPQLLPSLIKKEEKWIVPIGAIHGLQESTWKNNEIQLYTKDNLQKAVGTAKLETVGIEVCTLQPTFFDEIQNTDELLVGIYGNPLELTLQIEEEMQSTSDALLQFWNKKGLNHQIQLIDNASYQIKIKDNAISIYKKNQLITGGKWNPSSEDLVRDKDIIIAFISRSLQQIIKWEQIRNIQSPKSSKIDIEDIEIEFKYKHYGNDDSEKSMLISTGQKEGEESVDEITIPISKKDEYIAYEVHVTNNYKGYKPLYFYLVHLGFKYDINQRLPLFNKSLSWEATRSYKSLDDGKALGITAEQYDDSNIKSISQTFAVFAYDAPRGESLDAPYLFQQKGLDKRFGRICDVDELLGFKSEVSIPLADQPARWQVKKFEVHLVKA